MSRFFDYEGADNQYDYRVLTYPNITYAKDLEKDSYVVVIREVLRVLTKMYPRVYWILLLPETVNSLNFPHTEQRIMPLPTYPNRMRTHFDALRFSDLIRWRTEDIDIVYSHLPEHTAQLSNFFYNSTNLEPKIVGYSHWFEINENSPYQKRLFLHNLAGILEMDECGVNTQWLKELVLKRAAEVLSSKLVGQLEQIIQPHYLGVRETLDDSVRMYDKDMLKVVFNHRLNDYTGWNWLVPALDELWKERQDFRVYTTLGSIDRPWNKRIDAPTRKEYLRRLRDMDMGIGCFESYSAWSISTTDGLSQAVPYLLPNKLCYPEMVTPNYPMLYDGREEFSKMIRSILDDRSILVRAKMELKYIVPNMQWSKRVINWFGGWDTVFDPRHRVLKNETEPYQELHGFIMDRGFATKKMIMEHMNWGTGIPWTPYRNRLRQEKGFVFTNRGYRYEG